MANYFKLICLQSKMIGFENDVDVNLNLNRVGKVSQAPIFSDHQKFGKGK